MVRLIDNAVRHQYRELSEEEKAMMMSIKDKGLDLLVEINRMGDSREIRIAKQKVEEAVMWAVKHITA